jgi:hypothetical protein
VTTLERTAIDVRPLLTQERADLLDFLYGLSVAEWTAPPAAGWEVTGIALHLLNDDRGWLSRGREGGYE